MQSALKFNTQALQLDFTNLNQELTNLSLPTLDMNQIINQIQFNVSSDQLDHLANSLLNGYLEYEKNHPEVNINQATQEFINYLQTDHARFSNYVSIYAIIYAKFIILSTKRYSKKDDVYELFNGKCFSI